MRKSMKDASELRRPSVSSKPLYFLKWLDPQCFLFPYLPRAWFHLHLWNNIADLPWAQTSGYAKSWQSLLASSATHTWLHYSALGLVGGSQRSHCSPPLSSWWTFLFSKQTKEIIRCLIYSLLKITPIPKKNKKKTNRMRSEKCISTHLPSF